MNIYGSTISLLERGLDFSSVKGKGHLAKYSKYRHAEL